MSTKTQFHKSILLLILLLSVIVGDGQNETKKWYFGNGTGLNFLAVPPSTLAGSAMSTPEGCASIGDASGNLLFYTNGVTLWDRNHSIMANGTGLLGHNSTSQSSLILPLPGSTTLYYVFTNIGNNIFNTPNLHYSIVDISLSAGNGSVTTKNVMLSADPQTEMLTATRHCNGVDWWIVSHLRSSNVFVSFLLTSAGITGNSVLSFAGPSLLSGFSQMKLSPNGRKLAMNVGGVVYLGEFDNATGQTYGYNTIQNSTLGYGCEFSPNGGKLYTSAANGIYQFNLCAGSLPAILSSSVAVYSQNAAFGSFQLASNGKIYITYNTFTTSCHVINSPNNAGAACGFSSGVHQFLPASIQAGLPNFPGCYFYQKATPNPFFVSVSSSYGCYGALFDATILSNTCTAVTNSISGYTWDFGDPLTGTNNVSYNANQIHNFSGNGTFTVTLYVYYTCGVGTDTIRQPVVINDNCLNYSSSPASCASLGSATIAGAAGVGPFTYTWLPGNQTGTVASGLTPGSHTVVIRDSWANYTYSVPINLQPAVSLTAGVTLVSGPSCFGGSNGTGSISGVSGGSGSQSYSWNNGTQQINLQNPTNLSAGVWSVTVTDLLTACQANSVINIPQPSPLSPIISASSPTACTNGSVVLTCTASGGVSGYTYSWALNSGLPTKQVSETNPGQQTYTVQVWDINNCTTTQSVSITFINGPTLTVSSISICPGSTGTLQASGASSYTWLASTSSSATGATYTDSPVSNSGYTIIGSAAGCSASATASLFLFTVPQPSLQTNSPVCENGSLFLNAVGAPTITWLGPSSFSFSGTTVILQNVTLAMAGIYTINLISNQGCATSTTLNTVVNSTPAVSATGGTICTSQTLQLTSTSPNAATFQWLGPLAYTSTLQNPILQQQPVSASGLYTVVATTAANCTSTALANVLIISPPLINVVPSTFSICNQNFLGSNNSLTITPTGALLYTVQAPPQFSVSAGFTDFYLQPITQFSTSTVISSSIVGTNGICTSVKNFTFTVVPNPTLAITTSSASICIGEAATLTVGGAASYSWQPLAGNAQLINNGAGVIVQPLTSSTYSVFGSSGGCNSQIYTTSLLVKALPAFTASPLSSTVCENSSVVLKADGFGCTFNWINSVNANNVNGNQITVFPKSSQVHTVTANYNGCSKTQTLQIMTLTTPSPTISVSKNKICLTDTVFLTGEGGIDYFWYGPDGQSQRGSHAFFIPKTINNFLTYTLLVTGNNACSNSTTTAIEILKLPEGELENLPTSLCVPACRTFSFSSYTKSTVADFIIDGSVFSEKQLKHCFSRPGNNIITVNMRDVNTSCTATKQYSIFGYPKPQADFTYSPIVPVENHDEVIFTNKSSTENNTTYQWFFNDNKPFVAAGKNASYLFVNPGSYAVSLLATNEFNCSDTVIKVVNVGSDFSIYIPNSFTPNEDGKNDIFKPIVYASKNYYMRVFDRWGEEVFYTRDVAEGWNGSHGDESCPQDIYSYEIVLSNSLGERKQYIGTVLLLR